MSTQASLTNQRLDVARRFFAITVEEPWMGAAYENSALFHVQSAFISLLQEVKQTYSLMCAPELTEILESANNKNIQSPVLVELANLASQKESWLNQLMRVYQASLLCSLNSVGYKSDNLISSSNSGMDAGLSYLNALTDIILRFREESIEY